MPGQSLSHPHISYPRLSELTYDAVHAFIDAYAKVSITVSQVAGMHLILMTTNCELRLHQRLLSLDEQFATLSNHDFIRLLLRASTGEMNFLAVSTRLASLRMAKSDVV